MGQSVSCPEGSRQTLSSSVLHIVELLAEPLIFATVLHLFFFFKFVSPSPSALGGSWTGQFNLLCSFFVLFCFFSFLVAGDLFCKTKLDIMTSFIFGEHAATYAIYSR